MRAQPLIDVATVREGVYADPGPRVSATQVPRTRSARRLSTELRRDNAVVVFGEDVGRVRRRVGRDTRDDEEFGDRVFDTPISEDLIVGMAIGMALRGMRPVAELQYADFVFSAGAEVFLNTATYRYAHGGLLDLPMVVRMACGGGGFGPEHSQSTEAYLMHTPGFRVCLPSTAYDAKGLTLAAIRSNDPVFVLEHKRLYGVADDVPEDDYVVEFGRARRATASART